MWTDMEITGVWPLVLAVFITAICGVYVWEVAQRFRRRRDVVDLTGIEAFTSGSGGTEERMDEKCYDPFYAKVYDQLCQPSARAGMEVKVPLEWMVEKGRTVGDLRVADVGCGTGLHVELFAREGVHSVMGYDKSADMIAEARRRFPNRNFVVGDATVTAMAAAEQFDLLTMFYFTVYMVPEREQMLKNIYLWLAPGGTFVVHIVNKLKFDPVLESASPFVAFSIQKYSDERVTKSEVTFDEFEYTGDFQLHGSRGMYEENFRFKDGRTRRHEQRLWMPNIDSIMDEITGVGFKYAHHVDLTAIGYEYNYLFFFQK
jgi:ubiquinone/menaquinone biosynthesis C-methylase UbiE